MAKVIFKHINTYFKETDKQLLLFLVLFLNVKLLIKCLAILIIYFSKPAHRFGFKRKFTRLSFFYPVMICIGVLNYFINAGFTEIPGTVKLFFGIFSWLFCLLAMYQVKQFTEMSPVSSVHKAVTIFFLLNILVTAIQLFLIIIEIHDANPYRYQGINQKYFIGTGDYIKGLSFDTSTTNAVLNAFGVFYFLYRKQYLMVPCCMAALLLTGSNTTNIILLFVFLYCFIFQSSKSMKSIMVVCICMMVVFMTQISPQNNDYATQIVQHLLGKKQVANSLAASQADATRQKLNQSADSQYRIARNYLDSMAARDLQKAQYSIEKNERPVLPKDNIHSAPFQHKPDSSAGRMQVIQLAGRLRKNKDSVVLKQKEKLPGKILAVQESFWYLKTHPEKILTGSGMGNFSSKLAFRATGLNVSGGYPRKFVQINPAFADNHLATFLDYFGKDSGYHSVIHSPNSVYLQLLSEYGLIGVTAFLLLYLRYFIRMAGKKTEAIPLILLLSAFFFTDYWFEQLSVVMVFELLLFLQAGNKTVNQ